GPHISTPLRKNVAVHHSKNCALMSQMGLGCAKTPALAPHVEISLSNCISESQIILQREVGCLAGELCFLHFADVRVFTQPGSKPVVLWSSTRFPLRPQNPTSAR